MLPALNYIGLKFNIYQCIPRNGRASKLGYIRITSKAATYQRRRTNQGKTIKVDHV